MNSIVDEMLSYIGSDFYESKYLEHYGKGHLDGGHSGRYPYGSGDVPFQHAKDFLDHVNELKRKGMNESQIADELHIWNKEKQPSSTRLRIQISLATDEHKQNQRDAVLKLKERGLSNVEIAKQLGFKNESSVRSIIDTAQKNKMGQAAEVADFLKSRIDKVGMVEVGRGVAAQLNISEERMKQALYILEMQGYPTWGGRVPQVTNKGQSTTITVACPPGTPHKSIFNYGEIHQVNDYISYDGGKTFKKAFQYPASMDSSRLQIIYKEDGGEAKDGLIEIRRGVKDLDLGHSRYAQVRILVDDNKFLKGMAVYADDLPDGVDVRFNSNKAKAKGLEGALKPIEKDPENPFGSNIKEHGGQSYYIGDDGKEHLSLINKRAEEGDWDDWSNKLSAQFLSKQSKELMTKQLNLAIANKKEELASIEIVSNPTVKRKLLESFARDCDATAVNLNAAALPGQKYKVILPMTTLKDGEVYAPGYENGTKVALIRYPHAGTFEIPVLTVNNKNKEGQAMMTNAPLDAIGIGKKAADQLSGADFDGDTVMLIPTDYRTSSGGVIRVDRRPYLKDLEGFDNKAEYPYREGMKVMTKGYKGRAMGEITNLISDMQLKGATDEEVARAVKHSMVIIDAYKHKLDYKKSENDNRIKELKEKYQGVYEDGKIKTPAGTLITRAKSETSVPKRRGDPIINEDGSLSYKPAFDLYYTNYKTGETMTRMQTSTKMAEAKDAMELVSKERTQAELAYAQYANTMKALANTARKEMISTPLLTYDPEARKKYSEEVESLNQQLKLADQNKPREKAAQLLANDRVKKALALADEDLDKEHEKKLRQKELINARIETGSKRVPISITDKEWEAIQAGAISDNTLLRIIANSDLDRIKELATPRDLPVLSDSKKAIINTMLSSGYTQAEIADRLNVSATTINNFLKDQR